MTEREQIDEMAKVIEKMPWRIEQDGMGCRITNNTELAEYFMANGYRKATEVARAIFAEIERLMLDGAIGGKYPTKVINPDKYAELKKKYTEDTE